MTHIIYQDKLYEVCDITEHCYVVYDLEKGQNVYLPKEECEVV